ncbi:Putative Sensor histidine kinase [Clostridium chauvoei JF4335]|nr:Putative Sensor histidine kinase [Clostridium chauvoei JF4335]
MLVTKISLAVVFIVFCIWFLPLISYITIEMLEKKRYYDEVISVLNNLEKKYLLPEVINKPNFLEGKIVCDILREVSRDMNEQVKYYRDKENDYREYIETWVHEIKTPIASTRLIIDNNENPITNRIKTQINRVEGFIEQILYYSRSNDVSKDYIINSFELNKAITSVIKRNSRDFISRKIKLNLNSLDKIVYSDIKWVEFIINQVISNAIKYSRDKEPKISIYSTKENNSVALIIEDNGVGIIDRDLNRVFDKGFTGENGRIFGKSTGIGLYLCKNLCDKLGLGLELKSQIGEGTKVKIIFPEGRLTSF